MSPLFLVNWHKVNIRFRALMWAVAAVLAFVILVSSLPTNNRVERPPRAWAPAATSLSVSPPPANLKSRP
jgi:hypothetical protein